MIKTLKKTWKATGQWLKGWMTNPAAELSQTSRTLRFIAQLSIHVSRQLKQDKAAQIAAALSFRTLFSLLPLIVVVLMVFKALGLFNEALPALRNTVFRYLDLNLNASGQTGAIKGVGVATTQWFTENTDALTPLQQLHERADVMLDALQATLDRVNFGTLGWLGFVLFVWSAIRLIIAAEQSFNQIVKAPSQRGWTKRVIVYWAVITLGPVLLVISLSTAGLVAKRFESLPVLGQQAVKGANTFIAFGSAWLLFFLAYRFLPKRQLSTYALAMGAVMAALLWELWKHGFRIFLRHSFGSDGLSTNAALYGSVALLPVFFMWVQVTWMFVLFGLSFAYALHAMPDQSRSPFARMTPVQEAGIVDARWAVPVLACITQSFGERRPLNAERIAAQTALPQPAVDRILTALTTARLVYEITPPTRDESEESETDPAEATKPLEETNGYTLAAPADAIPMPDVLAVIRSLADNPKAPADLPGLNAFRKLLNASEQTHAGKTLADLLAWDQTAAADPQGERI